MTEKQFIFWLNGFLACISFNERIPTDAEWNHIFEQIQQQVCWIIEDPKE